MVKVAKERGFSIRETPRSFDFYRDEILVDRFLKFSTDYTLSEVEFKRRMEYIENY
jgi:hypothetical protein